MRLRVVGFMKGTRTNERDRRKGQPSSVVPTVPRNEKGGLSSRLEATGAPRSSIEPIRGGNLLSDLKETELHFTWNENIFLRWNLYRLFLSSTVLGT